MSLRRLTLFALIALLLTLPAFGQETATDTLATTTPPVENHPTWWEKETAENPPLPVVGETMMSPFGQGRRSAAPLAADLTQSLLPTVKGRILGSGEQWNRKPV